MDHDATLTRAGPSLEGDQTAAISDRGKRHGIERCTVDQSRRARWKPAADSGTHVVTAFHDDVGTKPAHEPFIGSRRSCQHAQAVGFRQLDRESADRTRAAENRDRGRCRKGERVH
jgi:hypothetical protein